MRVVSVRVWQRKYSVGTPWYFEAYVSAEEARRWPQGSTEASFVGQVGFDVPIHIPKLFAMQIRVGTPFRITANAVEIRLGRSEMEAPPLKASVVAILTDTPLFPARHSNELFGEDGQITARNEVHPQIVECDLGQIRIFRSFNFESDRLDQVDVEVRVPLVIARLDVYETKLSSNIGELAGAYVHELELLTTILGFLGRHQMGWNRITVYGERAQSQVQKYEIVRPLPRGDSITVSQSMDKSNVDARELC